MIKLNYRKQSNKEIGFQIMMAAFVLATLAVELLRHERSDQSERVTVPEQPRKSFKNDSTAETDVPVKVDTEGAIH